MNLKILQVTSVVPPYKCGIGDFVVHLVEVLKKNIDVKILAKGNTSFKLSSWPLFNFFTLLNPLKDINLVHIHYPGKDIRYFFVLILLIGFTKLKKIKLLLTLHEYEISFFLRKLSSLLLIFLVDHIIFTNEREKYEVTKVINQIGLHMETSIIGLAPTIINQNLSKKLDRKVKKIATFSLFYPGRCIDDVIQVFNRLKGEKLKFYIIGSYDKDKEWYFKKIYNEAISLSPKLKIDFILNKDYEFLKSFFREIDLFVLLYKDGVSFKRTSFLSTLSFGIPVVSNYGPATPNELVDGENILLGKDINEIVNKVEHIINSKELYFKISQNAFELSLNFSWEKIANKHLEIYNKVFCIENKTTKN